MLSISLCVLLYAYGFGLILTGNIKDGEARRLWQTRIGYLLVPALALAGISVLTM